MEDLLIHLVIAAIRQFFKCNRLPVFVVEGQGVEGPELVGYGDRRGSGLAMHTMRLASGRDVVQAAVRACLGPGR